MLQIKTRGFILNQSSSVINGQGFGGWFKQKLCAHAAGRILPLPPERGSVTRSNVRIASATIGLTRV